MDAKKAKKPRFQRYMELLDQLEEFFVTEKSSCQTRINTNDQDSGYDQIFNELDTEVIRNIDNILESIKEKREKLKEEKAKLIEQLQQE